MNTTFNKFLSFCQKQYDSVEAQSDISTGRGGVRCQLLKWFSSEDVIVGEGELCSLDPAYKIGRIPLGPGAAAVIVKTVIDTESNLWRPTPTMFSLGEAVGFKIPWPAAKVIVDDTMPYNPNKPSESSKVIFTEFGYLIATMQIQIGSSFLDVNVHASLGRVQVQMTHFKNAKFMIGILSMVSLLLRVSCAPLIQNK